MPMNRVSWGERSRSNRSSTRRLPVPSGAYGSGRAATSMSPTRPSHAVLLSGRVRINGAGVPVGLREEPLTNPRISGAGGSAPFSLDSDAAGEVAMIPPRRRDEARTGDLGGDGAPASDAVRPVHSPPQLGSGARELRSPAGTKDE